MSKAQLTRLATRIFNTPLLIHPAKFDTILTVLGDRLGMDSADLGLTMVQGVDVPKKEMVALRVGGQKPSANGAAGSSSPGVTLAVIPVFGSLVQRAGGIDAMSGLRGYEALRADYRKAQADKTFDAVVLEFATNGGEGHGLFDLVDEIRQACLTGKPTYAIVNEYAYSAGYALASACTEVFLTRTSGVGSIGVISRHADYSAKNENDGVRYTTMFVGDRKNDFSSEGPLTDQAKEILHASMVKSYDLFVATVAANRNLPEKAVRATQAGVYEGQAAVDAGLADAVLSFDQAINRIAQKTTKQTGGTRMSGKALQHQLEALFKGSSDTEIALALEPMGYMSKANAITAEAKQVFGQEQFAAGHKAAFDQSRELIAMCELGGTPQLVAGLIKAETKVEDARKTIIDASASGQHPIVSTVNPAGGGQANLLLANAQARKAKFTGQAQG